MNTSSLIKVVFGLLLILIADWRQNAGTKL